jgi:hypothetical protein
MRERAIVALLSEKTLGAAARRCGVNEKTLRRWRAEDEDFKQAFAQARAARFQAAMDRAQVLTVTALETLEELMGPTVPPTVRLGAARTVAEFGMHQHDAETIVKRLDELERAVRRGSYDATRHSRTADEQDVARCVDPCRT